MGVKGEHHASNTSTASGGGGDCTQKGAGRAPNQGTYSKYNKLCRSFKFLKLLSFGMSRVVVRWKELPTFSANNQLAQSIKSCISSFKNNSFTCHPSLYS
jgi:hypothetical protein